MLRAAISANHQLGWTSPSLAGFSVVNGWLTAKWW